MNNTMQEFLIEIIQKQGRGAIPKIAKAIGISPNSIYAWVNYGIYPTIDNYEKMVNYLGYDIKFVEKR